MKEIERERERERAGKIVTIRQGYLLREREGEGEIERNLER